MRVWLPPLILSLVAWLGIAPAHGADGDPAEQAAARLLVSTVTLRISTKPADALVSKSAAAEKPSEAAPADSAAPANNPPLALPANSATPAGANPKTIAKESGAEIVVCSGVSLGGGRVVTFWQQPPSTAPVGTSIAAPEHRRTRFRVTLPGGEQAVATPRVIDRYSGLMLLDLGDKNLPGLQLAEALPAVGGTVLTAAAAGVERPAVSQGILGASDRSLSGVDLPPLLQCDVRTADTGSGAAVVDRQGRLIGVIVATPSERGGWAYALPVEHVRRLLAAWQDNKTVELQRRRPVVGLTLGAGSKDGQVRVERVEAGGPAAQAGIVPGDLVLEADGLKIRSPYQAVNSIMRKQPGDRISLTVQHGDETKNCPITLDGGAVIATNNEPANAPMGRRVVRVYGLGGGQFVVGNPDEPQQARADSTTRPARTSGDEAETQRALRKLQDELARRDADQAETQKVIDTLTGQVEQLRKQLDRTKPPPK